MLTVILVELAKLRRSLVLLLCVAAPVFIAVLNFLLSLDNDKPVAWTMFMTSGAAMWAYFMLPMTVTALTVLIAQLEHGAKTWNAVLAFPVPRWQIFAAKAIIALGLVAAMSTALLGLMLLAGTAVEAIKPGDTLLGKPDVWSGARSLATMFTGSLLLIAIQLWAALRFRSFVPPLVLGIGGTFVAVAATSTKHGAWFPWLIAVQTLKTHPSGAEAAIGFGFWGGLIVMLLMLMHMSRYEAP